MLFLRITQGYEAIEMCSIYQMGVILTTIMHLFWNVKNIIPIITTLPCTFIHMSVYMALGLFAHVVQEKLLIWSMLVLISLTTTHFTLTWIKHFFAMFDLKYMNTFTLGLTVSSLACSLVNLVDIPSRTLLFGLVAFYALTLASQVFFIFISNEAKRYHIMYEETKKNKKRHKPILLKQQRRQPDGGISETILIATTHTSPIMVPIQIKKTPTKKNRNKTQIFEIISIYLTFTVAFVLFPKFYVNLIEIRKCLVYFNLATLFGNITGYLSIGKVKFNAYFSLLMQALVYGTFFLVHLLFKDPILIIIMGWVFGFFSTFLYLQQKKASKWAILAVNVGIFSGTCISNLIF